MLFSYKFLTDAKPKDIFKALTPGSGIICNYKVLDEGESGQYRPKLDPEQISLSTDLLNKYENGNASNLLLDATLFHELTHYFNHKGRNLADQGIEVGFSFELAVWNSVLVQVSNAFFASWNPPFTYNYVNLGNSIFI